MNTATRIKYNVNILARCKPLYLRAWNIDISTVTLISPKKKEKRKQEKPRDDVSISAHHDRELRTAGTRPAVDEFNRSDCRSAIYHSIMLGITRLTFIYRSLMSALQRCAPRAISIRASSIDNKRNLVSARAQ